MLGKGAGVMMGVMSKSFQGWFLTSAVQKRSAANLVPKGKTGLPCCESINGENVKCPL